MSICARAFRSSPSRWGSVPIPAEPKFSAPGWDFARPINSATDLAGTDGCTASISVLSATRATGANDPVW